MYKKTCDNMSNVESKRGVKKTGKADAIKKNTGGSAFLNPEKAVRIGGGLTLSKTSTYIYIYREGERERETLMTYYRST